MNVAMSGLDYELAPIELREGLSFTRHQVKKLDVALRAYRGVEGCVLLSTCNRTEIYISGGDGIDWNPGALLCEAAGVDYASFAPAFVTRRGQEATRHLMEVAGGLRSQIWGEDQIVTQVKTAIEIARDAGTADGVLETLFRSAVSAGKEIKTKVRLVGVPVSVAQRAVEVLVEVLGGFGGRRALVIGNGEMGRLAAELLRRRGCTVTVTLRTYRHGETLVPAGCGVVLYEERYGAMEGADLIISATTSPHYTVIPEELKALKNPPSLMVDLSIPRDIHPFVGELPGVTLYNVDTLGGAAGREVPAEAAEIMEKHMLQLEQWDNYRACLPALERVKRAVLERVVGVDAGDSGSYALMELTVSRTVDLLSGALKENLNPADLLRCAEKIELRTAAHPNAATVQKRSKRSVGEQTDFRFPIFIPLSGGRAVVVGGGAVACRRAEVLRRFGAEVTIIAPTCASLPRGVNWEQRPYEPGDLAGAVLAVAATDQRRVNRAAGEEARTLGIPVSVADCPEECTFFFPAICEGENLVAGVVSRGDDHALTARAAKAIRQTLEGLE